jgi:hypothetical protein
MLRIGMQKCIPVLFIFGKGEFIMNMDFIREVVICTRPIYIDFLMDEYVYDVGLQFVRVSKKTVDKINETFKNIY